MSALPSRAPVPAPAEPAPSLRTATLGRLRVVRAPARPRARVPFGLMCVGILAAALVGVLLLNTSMAQTSFTIQERQVRLAQLSELEQDLNGRLEAAASPQVLAERAVAEGMVSAPPPAFLDLASGTIVGSSVAAGPR